MESVDRSAEVGVSLSKVLRYSLIALLCIAVGGCFSPTYSERLACSESGRCPGDLECKYKQCVKPGTNNMPDACVPQPGMRRFTATGSMEPFEVPTCITSLNITAIGAGGGGVPGDEDSAGRPASISGEFAVGEGKLVSSSDTLHILVGKHGIDATDFAGNQPSAQGGGSGGGGSFVVGEEDQPLVIAGGGGGATFRSADGGVITDWGENASTARAGANGKGDNAGLGGEDGNGGASSTMAGGFHGGTGGGGFVTGGMGSSYGNTTMHGTANAPGQGFLEGGAGGVAGSEGRNGGFGGGGAAGATGGGGGGYSGGGAGGTPTVDSLYAGGGGGSYNQGTNQQSSNLPRVGDGEVIIVWN